MTKKQTPNRNATSDAAKWIKGVDVGYNYQHPQYLAARDEAFARSDGICQFCGQKPAVEAHHWAERYPPESETTADDLTALCGLCHEMATTKRRFVRLGGDDYGFMAAFKTTIAEELRWNKKSPSRALGPSSSTTDRPESTPGALPKSKLPKSTARKARTGPSPMTSDSGNWNAKSAFTLTRAERLHSQKRLSDPASKPAPAH